jgi:hypothetical protein
MLYLGADYATPYNLFPAGGALWIRNSSILNCSCILIKAFSFLGTHFSTINLFGTANRYFGVVLK